MKEPVFFLNGEFLPRSEARISPEDRGFLLSDGVYEVAPFYDGSPFALREHLDRLASGIEWMRIPYDVSRLAGVPGELVRRNGIADAPTALVYLQVTRGAAPRTHFFPPEPVEPTVFGYAKAWDRPEADRWEQGFSAVTVPDLRWGRVDIKTVSLLPNVLAFQRALDLGADDALLVRDGIAIEGAHQNFWGVFDGTAVTHPLTANILPGVTRRLVLELASEAGVPCSERPIAVEEIELADELFFTGTTGEIRPCTEVDGKMVGDGMTGEVTRKLSRLFRAHVERTATGG
ncbi:MAG: D-amino acid aminotransferase [Gemmatimonadetes bacterium]|nr:D-amino acid aminotransferase [Gemmatimonadota bacterium]